MTDRPSHSAGAPQQATLDIPLLTLRALFFASAMGSGLYVAREFDSPELQFVSMLVAGVLAILVMLVDRLAIARSDISTVSSIVFGLLIGFLTSQLFIGIVSLMGDYEGPEGKQQLQAIRLALMLIFCYLGPAYILRTKDDIRFIVPYVEFQKERRGPTVLVLDTSAVIDGRIVELAAAGLFDAPLVVHRAVVEELQRLADLSDRNRRGRGRRGLERLKALQELPRTDVQLLDVELAPAADVDRALVELCKARNGKLVTVDYNLHKVGELEGVPVLNLNSLAETLRPQLLPGEPVRVKIVKPGEGPNQGVGYLDDGTMVVVEGGRRSRGRTVTALVTSAIQSSVGRMVFARIPEGDLALQLESPRAEPEERGAEERGAEERGAGEPAGDDGAPASAGEERA